MNAGLPAGRAPGPHRLRPLRRPARRPLRARRQLRDGAARRPRRRRNDAYGVPSSGFVKGAHVYRSDDGGDAWRLVAPATPEVMTRYLARHSGTFGWVFGQIRVDPNDPETVYIMGVPLSVSNDGGRTFRELTGMHGDHHGLWIDPANSDYLVNANDGGVVVSYDRGKTPWRRHIWTTSPSAEFFNVSFDMATPFRVYGSMQEPRQFPRGRSTSRAAATASAAQAFESAPGGEGSTHAVDPADPRIVFSSGFLRQPDPDRLRRAAMVAEHEIGPCRPTTTTSPGSAASGSPRPSSRRTTRPSSITGCNTSSARSTAGTPSNASAPTSPRTIRPRGATSATRRSSRSPSRRSGPACSTPGPMTAAPGSRGTAAAPGGR